MPEVKNKKVMAAGHICLDITPKFPLNQEYDIKKLLRPGALIEMDEVVLGTGGAVSNTGLAMSKLGLEVLLNGKVGDDEFGGIIKKLLGKKAKAFKTVTGQSSSYTIVIAVPGYDRLFFHHPGTNDTFTSDDIDYQSARDCCLFHFGYPTLMKGIFENDCRELEKIYKNVKELGIVTSLDMSMPDPLSDAGKVDWHDALKRTLPYVDIFLPSVEEIAFMLDRELFEKRKNEAGVDDPVLVYTPEDVAGLAEKMLDMGVKIAAIKNGIRGYYLRTADESNLADINLNGSLDGKRWSGRELWAGSYKAEVFGSATGAGDATIAGFLSGLVNGHEPEECLKIANTVGWQNVKEFDTLSGIKDWDTTLEMAGHKNKETNFVMEENDKWKFDTEEKIFIGPNDKGK